MQKKQRQTAGFQAMTINRSIASKASHITDRMYTDVDISNVNAVIVDWQKSA